MTRAYFNGIGFNRRVLWYAGRRSQGPDDLPEASVILSKFHGIRGNDRVRWAGSFCKLLPATKVILRARPWKIQPLESAIRVKNSLKAEIGSLGYI